MRGDTQTPARAARTLLTLPCVGLLLLLAAPGNAQDADAPAELPVAEGMPELPSTEGAPDLPVTDAMPELPPGLDLPADTPGLAQSSEDASIAWGLDAQLWLQRLTQRATPLAEDTRAAHVGRLVLDFRREWQLGRRWTVGLSNQWQGTLGLHGGEEGRGFDSALNNLRELWVRWQVGDDAQPLYFDVGRINLRNGVGSGYNPTDFFKAGAVRQPLSLDPNAFRLNRLGTVMLMAQYLHESGAWTAALVPPLSTQDPMMEGPWYSPALHRTNRDAALYAKWAPQVREWLSLDVLLLARVEERPRLGVNLSALLGSAWVFNAEGLVGGCHRLGGPDAPERGYGWCMRLATNVMWTLPLGIELTLEQQFASDALDADDWRQWRGVTDARLGTLAQMRGQRSFQLEPMLRHGSFARLAWRDAFAVRGLELSSFVQVNNFDWSGLTQQAVAWSPWTDWSIGGQLQQFFGARDSEYGSASTTSRLSLFLSRRQ